MSELTALAGRIVEAGPREIYPGRLASSPSVGELAAVSLDRDGNRHRYDGVLWTPKVSRSGVVLPVRGDRCSVAEMLRPDGTADRAIVEWMPSAEADPFLVGDIGGELGGDLSGPLTDALIVDGAVTSAKIKWDEMPTHLMCSWVQNTTYENSLQGSLIPFDASGSTALSAMRHVVRPLPSREGYSRQYRLFGRFAHLNAAGETGWRVQMKFDTVAINVSTTNVATQAVDYNSGWTASATIDGWGASGSDTPLAVTPTGGADYAGAAATVTCRGYILEGRYV